MDRVDADFNGTGVLTHPALNCVCIPMGKGLHDGVSRCVQGRLDAWSQPNDEPLQNSWVPKVAQPIISRPQIFGVGRMPESVSYLSRRDGKGFSERFGTRDTPEKSKAFAQ